MTSLPGLSLASLPASLLVANAKGVDHVAIAVRDLDKALLFYTAVLGFTVEEQRETKGERTGMRSAVLSGGPLSFVLVQGTSPESQVSRFIDAYGPGVQHIAIEVVDLGGVVNDLKTRGMDFVTSIIKHNGLHQSFAVRDEDSGIMIELIERVDHQDGFAESNIDELFRQMESTDHF